MQSVYCEFYQCCEWTSQMHLIVLTNIDDKVSLTEFLAVQNDGPSDLIEPSPLKNNGCCSISPLLFAECIPGRKHFSEHLERKEHCPCVWTMNHVSHWEMKLYCCKRGVHFKNIS